MANIIRVIPKVDLPENLKRINLKDAYKLLEFVNSNIGKRIVVDEFDVIKPWAVLVLAAMGAEDNENKIFVENNRSTNAAKFAFSLGLDKMILGDEDSGKYEEKRTVKLHRVKRYEQIETVSEKISKLIFSDEPKKIDLDYEPEEVRLTLRYVLIELIRNVVQHSEDPNGALVIAQRMNKLEREDENSHIQITVSDRGIGILESLKAFRKELKDPLLALERSLWPGYSGKFAEFQTGSSQNAGMGLFFVSEIAKLTAGKFFIASKGASLYIEGDPEFLGNNKIDSHKVGYDGTLVVFEMPKKGVDDYNSLIKTISKKAVERRDRRHSANWIRFDIPKEKVIEFVINVSAENTIQAEEFAKNELIPRLRNKEPILLNFVQIKICTQSFMHSLLYEAVKYAYEYKVPLYVKNTSPSVHDAIKLVEMYGLTED